MSKSDQNYDYQSKVIIIGDSAVGKTSLLTRFTSGLYKSSHTATIGVDFKSKIIEISQSGKKTKLKMQLWDTAGQ